MNDKEIPCGECVTLAICMISFKDKGLVPLIEKCSIIRKYLLANRKRSENRFITLTNYLLNKIERNNK